MLGVRWVVAVVLAAAMTAGAQAPAADSAAIEQRAQAMVKRLTLEQKIRLLGGEDSVWAKGEPAVGFPRLKMSDGPIGARFWGATTAYTAGIGMAATWDPELAERVGAAIGNDARARGVHILLGPAVNIYRAPMTGRNFEYYGEDPLLAGRLVVGFIRGLQSRGVMATVKHFAANNQEYDRHNVSSDMDERTLREIYLPAFEAAVKEGDSGAVMNSYNLVNGVHATQNQHLNNEILKGEWGFKGILMSDWWSTYDGVAAANGGLDLEMPDPDHMNAATLLPAVKSGKVPESVIDDKVLRLFRTAIRFGFLDREQTDYTIPTYSQESRAVALDEARESIVLLKNEGGLLPLDVEKVKTIAVLGPDAWPAVTGGGGSSQVIPYAAQSVLTGLSDALAGKVKVLTARGVPPIDEMLSKTEFRLPEAVKAAKLAGAEGHAVVVEPFDNAEFHGSPVATRFVDHIDTLVNQEWGQPQAKALRYETEVRAAKAGKYIFVANAGGGGSYKLYVDGKLEIDQPAREGIEAQWVELELKAGETAAVRLDYVPGGGNPQVGLAARPVETLVTDEARAIAKLADVIVVDAGFDATTESEGYDRTYALPWGQDELIETAEATNPRTIVLLTAGGDVDARRWIARTPAVLHLWYPGQEGPRALAEILTGARSPEGRLPITFPQGWEENPVHDNYYAAPVAKGETPHVAYKEGVFVGYRSFVTTGKKPLFPFGFGLTYTTFGFSGLKVTPEVKDGRAGAVVEFDVENTGKTAAAEVAQVYVGEPGAKVARPRIELKGFRKVRLEPGAKEHVRVALDERAFSYWDTAAKGWKWDAGKFAIAVGDSSENTPLAAEIELKK